MSRYSKGIEGVDHYHQPDDLFRYLNEPFDVRVTVLDERPDVGLWATMDADDVNRPIGDLLDEFVIGSTREQTEFIREKMLELEEFPHLSDALDRVADIWHRYRAGEADVDICINNGPDDISLDDSAYQQMCTCVWRDGSWDYMLLDIVLEPSELTLAGMLGARKQEFLLWMQGLIALYKFDTDSTVEKLLRKHSEAEGAREQLFHHNLVAKDERGRLAITQQGRRAIGRLLDEQDELEALYDIYRDVVIRPSGESFKAEFGTLSGADYRVAVFEHEELDPFRSVFLLTLMSGELDEELQGKRWIDLINDDRFYEGILAPAVDHAVLEEEKLAELVAQGAQYLARTDAQRNRAAYSQRVLQRARTIEAFPRPKKGDEPKQLRPFMKAGEEHQGSEEEPPKQLPPAKEATESAEKSAATTPKGKGPGKGKGKGQGRPSAVPGPKTRRRFGRGIDQTSKFWKIQEDE